MTPAASAPAAIPATGVLTLRQPYLLFLGAVTNRADAKTGIGLRDWCPDRCLGQLRLAGCDVDLGLPDLSPAEAALRGAGSLVIGVAAAGGRLDPSWIPTFEAALDAGLDIVSGLHQRLDATPQLARRAEKTGGRLVDVRVPTRSFPVGTGRRRSGKRVLTVGTDCAIGKKYAALAIAAELKRRGHDATFRATGQTGILIAGGGVAVDAVVADFIAGAAEQLTPDAPATHWDVIEGQGSLFHPAFAGVSLGLLHGSQPDAIVACHEAGRAHLDDLPHMPMPTLEATIERNLEAARLTNPAVRCIGISLNTASLGADEAQQLIETTAARLGLPVVDPLRGGVGPLCDAIERLS